MEKVFRSAEFLTPICSHLLTEDLFLMVCVCHQWKSVLLSMPAGWANVSLASNKKCGALLLRYSQWSHRHQVEYLSLEFCNKLTDDMLEVLSEFPNLRSLNLNGCSGITDRALKLVAHCKLSHLELFWNPTLSNQGMMYLAQGMETCVLTHSYLLGPHIQQLSFLNLSGVKYLTDEAITALVSRLPNLLHLDLTRLELLRDASLVAISQHCPNLRQLLLYACANFTDEGILALAQGCQRLESLDLAGLFYS